MNDGDRVNRSALFAGALRASHMLWDEPPWIIADPYAWLWNPAESRNVMLKSRERVGEVQAGRVRGKMKKTPRVHDQDSDAP